eukprot:scaffold2363_cov159-Amphora_coffeaeformis.AAC.53
MDPFQNNYNPFGSNPSHSKPFSFGTTQQSNPFGSSTHHNIPSQNNSFSFEATQQHTDPNYVSSLEANLTTARAKALSLEYRMKEMQDNHARILKQQQKDSLADQHSVRRERDAMRRQMEAAQEAADKVTRVSEIRLNQSKNARARETETKQKLQKLQDEVLELRRQAKQNLVTLQEVQAAADKAQEKMQALQHEADEAKQEKENVQQALRRVLTVTDCLERDLGSAKKGARAVRGKLTFAQERNESLFQQLQALDKGSPRVSKNDDCSDQLQKLQTTSHNEFLDNLRHELHDLQVLHNSCQQTATTERETALSNKTSRQQSLKKKKKQSKYRPPSPRRRSSKGRIASVSNENDSSLAQRRGMRRLNIEIPEN